MDSSIVNAALKEYNEKNAEKNLDAVKRKVWSILDRVSENNGAIGILQRDNDELRKELASLNYEEPKPLEI